jgi:hypothetical protein
MEVVAAELGRSREQASPFRALRVTSKVNASLPIVRRKRAEEEVKRARREN